MAGYRITLRKSVEKDIDKIPQKDLQAILKKIESLRKNPRPRGCRKLVFEERYRLRQGDYRILYSVDDSNSTVLIVKVAHRRDAYR